MRFFFLTVLLLLVRQGVEAQAPNQLPKADLKTLDNKTVSSTTFANEGKPMVICFWATWCKPCIKELEVYSEKYKDWREETGVKLIAVSIDNARSMSRVAPFVNGKGWDYEVFLDPNEDFKRAMNVVNVPHTFLIDGNGNIVWQHTSYADGDEEELITMIRKVAAGEKLN